VGDWATYLQVVHIGWGEQKTEKTSQHIIPARAGKVLTGQTNRTNEPDIHDALVTETDGPEVDFILRREPDLVSQMRWR
jgi:hypothetical protein